MNADDLLSGKLTEKQVDRLVELVLPEFYAIAALDGLDTDFAIPGDFLILFFRPFFFYSFLALSKQSFYTSGSMTAGGYSFSRPNGKTKSKQAPKRQKFTVEGQV